MQITYLYIGRLWLVALVGKRIITSSLQIILYRWTNVMQINRHQRGTMGEKVQYLEDFETGDIQHTNEELPLALGVQCLVDTTDEPLEHPVVDGLGHGVHTVHHLRAETVECHHVTK